MILSNGLLFAAVFITVGYGLPELRAKHAKLYRSYDTALNQQLLMNVNPNHALLLTLCGGFVVGLFAGLFTETVGLGLVAGLGALALPPLIADHLKMRRIKHLDRQLTDGLTTLASGTRAGLTLVQSMNLVVQNSIGPIQEEFAQILREYEMGLDLNQAMRNASDRIGSHLYRLTFTAIEMHRIRGGNAAESMDRIAESVREIERLEGKLDALTAQGRMQATFMAIMPPVFLMIYYAIEPTAVDDLMNTGTGRIILAIVAALVLGGFLWIRKIMSVDI